MPLQKRKKKSKPASDKSVKQIVTQVVKVNIGDTKPKKKRKRKSGGGGARAAVQAPMLAQVPQQFIYPPQSFPQEAPMAPPRQAPPSVEVPDPFPVSALNRVLGSVPRSTLAVQPEVQRPTLMRPAEKPQLVMPEQPVMVPRPSLRPPPVSMTRNVEVVDAPKPFVAKPKLRQIHEVGSQGDNQTVYIYSRTCVCACVCVCVRVRGRTRTAREDGRNQRATLHDVALICWTLQFRFYYFN